MKQDEREKLNRAISEKRGEWADSDICAGCEHREVCHRPPAASARICEVWQCECAQFSKHYKSFDWCSEWRYAGRLLEEMHSAGNDIRIFGDAVNPMTEAIALAWAKMNGVSREAM